MAKADEGRKCLQSACFHLFKGSQETAVSRKAKRGQFSKGTTLGLLLLLPLLVFLSTSSKRMCRCLSHPSTPTSTKASVAGATLHNDDNNGKSRICSKVFSTVGGDKGGQQPPSVYLELTGSPEGVKCAGVLYRACQGLAKAKDRQ